MTEGRNEALLDRLHSDPRILGGLVCVKGTRVPVAQILAALASGETADDLLRGYPTLTHEDIRAALAYAARLAHERVLPLRCP
jgi:uncharacterized protein (DUF433 family)